MIFRFSNEIAKLKVAIFGGRSSSLASLSVETILDFGFSNPWVNFSWIEYNKNESSKVVQFFGHFDNFFF